MNPLSSNRSKLSAVFLGVGVAAFAGASWAFVWYWISMALAFATCTKIPCFTTTIFVPGAIIPVLYVPFLARMIVLNRSEDRRLSQIAFYIALALAVVFSFWLEWWDQQGSR